MSAESLDRVEATGATIDAERWSLCCTGLHEPNKDAIGVVPVWTVFRDHAEDDCFAARSLGSHSTLSVDCRRALTVRPLLQPALRAGPMGKVALVVRPVVS